MNGSIEDALSERLRKLETQEIPRLQEAALEDENAEVLLASAERERNEALRTLQRWRESHGEPWDEEAIEVGDTVDVVEVGSDEVERYVLVWESGSRPSDGWITDVSPLGRALIGSKRGDEVVVDAPVGRRTFRIVGFSRSV